MTSEEVRTMHSRSHEQETYQEQKAWRDKIARLCRQDARQFIRAGFRQVMPPSLARGDYYHFFAVPSFLQGDIMTNADAHAVTIVDAPERTLPPVGLDLQIRDLLNREMMAGVSSRHGWRNASPARLQGTGDGSSKARVRGCDD